MTCVEPLTFYGVTTPDGLALLTRPGDPWPDHIGITDQFLDLADPEYVTGGDGMVRFSLAHGGALYGYAHPDDNPKSHHYDLIRVEER